ncbi:hypothetical protein [Bacillus pumilus]|uniref:Uncharacterized protein n=1 Tax=Bacillus pumilus TaxID=1408 RepID=A0AAD0HNC4_BACPU|nr:hypothetical protein [Bacillus pumilus]AVM24291.1 hypothetical protein C5695_10770 [Bacillus pumilus]TYS42796.1 hypothetical protein FZC68_10320 [Bacillus pumilus]
MKKYNQKKSQNEGYSIQEETSYKVIYRVHSAAPEPIAVIYPGTEQGRFNIDVRYLGKEFGFKSEEAIRTAIHLHEKIYVALETVLK